MTDHRGRVSIYGNPVPERRRAGAERWRRRMARKYKFDDTARYPLYARNNPTVGRFLGVKDIYSGVSGEPIDTERGIIVGNIRMGYGHYRIAMSVASTAQAMGLVPYWFDLLGFDSPGARLIKDLDYWYSFGSKLSQKSALFNRFVWDPMFGKAYKRAEKNYNFVELCHLFTDVYKELPPETPFLATHPWLALAAVHAHRKNIINMIPDNCPLGFHLAEGALHTVQGPSMYLGFLTMRGMASRGADPQGVPFREMRQVGHYVDHELVVNVESDCNARIDRIDHKLPRRVLISVGGAGAQQDLLATVVTHLLPLVREGRVVLFINFGDHRKAFDLFTTRVPGFSELAAIHTQWDESTNFIQSTLTGPVKGLHTFLHEDVFAAVYATNLLMRASDFLITKPSELAFYPLPKLLLPRVGGHEAWGAIRCGELGDGTTECATTEEVIRLLDTLVLQDDLLRFYCDNIVRLNRLGGYSGAYRVIELALERRNAK